ncbi:MAG: DUF3899 domain-containing protein, partial [Clostridia bacterium]|nr:DUF3899 domain-containing protein [Clostridia bacterium]
MKKKLLTLTILILVHIGIILTVCGIDGVFTESMAQQEVVRFVCDGFYVAGILYLCIGGLIWASKEGAFDGLGYTVSNWKHSIFHNTRDWKKKETFQEYKERVSEKKKGRRVNEAIIIGGVSILIASVLLIVYH